MKPPYHVMSMSEIQDVPWNGFNVVSTFSGAGGSCLGYRMAGYRVLWANEFIPAAQEVYRTNHPSSLLDTRDIRTIRGTDIFNALGEKSIDILDGSPPCASFSSSGARERGWGREKIYSDTRQRVDDLFFEFSRLLSELRPKIFVAENVAGLVRGVAIGYFKEILAALSRGYRVAARLLDAQWLGVPQSRKRLVFVGVRDDLGLDPAHPRPLPYRYTVADAWRGMETEHGPVFSGYAIEKYYWECKNGNHPTVFNLKRLQWDYPSNTVCQNVGKGTAAIAHPDVAAYPSINQIKRLCGFPDDFVLTGTFERQWERLGRAVPPVMMMHIADTIKREILCKL